MKIRGYTEDVRNWIADVGISRRKPAYSTEHGAMYHADSLEVLRKMKASTVDMVFTSPPFALTRKKEYGNETIERYLAWLLPFTEQIHRVLKPDGSFVLDIGGAWIPGAPVRSTYHFEVAIQLVKSGFKLAQEFYWYNPSRLPTPAEWVTVRRIRVKDAVNMVWWFSKSDFPKANNRKVLQPYSDSMKSLLKNGYKAKKRPSGHDISTKFGTDNGGAIPPNLLSIANTESNSQYQRTLKEWKLKGHPARFPTALVEFFLDFLTDPNDLVYDPFGGSNTTGYACELKGRRWLASEVLSKYVKGSLARFVAQGMFEEKEARAYAVGKGTYDA